jgi:hypothetical protein
MPIHSLKNVQRLIRAEAWAIGTPKCRAEIAEQGLSQAEAVAMILLLTRSDHTGERPGMDSDFGPINADQYILCVDEDGNRCQRGDGTPHYMKFGIDTNDEGDACVVVSFHPPVYPI